MEKLDLKKTYKHLYNPPATVPQWVDVPPLNALMINGSGDPNVSQDYAHAIETLYAVAYTLKFMSKNQAGIDYTVLPLEGLWWAEDMDAFSLLRKHEWLWTALIVQPEHISAEMVTAAIEQARAKKNPAALDKLRFDTYHEGLSAQIMHLGPYAAEGPTIERLHAWIEMQGYTYRGAKHHHEIYLSDPRRVAPEKMKTIIRQPVIRAGE